MWSPERENGMQGLVFDSKIFLPYTRFEVTHALVELEHTDFR